MTVVVLHFQPCCVSAAEAEPVQSQRAERPHSQAPHRRTHDEERQREEFPLQDSRS